MIQISFVIPCYRSANTIIQVLKEIEDKMAERPDTVYEVITVNDSSPDNVLQVLRDYAESHSWLRVVDFTKNFGQHAAMMAGLSFASGKYIVFLELVMQSYSEYHHRSQHLNHEESLVVMITSYHAYYV